jgi:shikimate kinase
MTDPAGAKGTDLRPNSVSLIGMPGSGKSTIGIVLAKALGYSFVDTDVLIQSAEKNLLQEIINDRGIAYFLEIEEKAILSVSGGSRVIATGGSAVYGEKAMRHLQDLGMVIYLRMDLETIVKRIRNFETRGIVIGADQTVEDIYRIRAPLYEKYARLTIDCRDKEFECIVGEICRALHADIDPRFGRDCVG